jgi:uncharacterized membrane protein
MDRSRAMRLLGASLLILAAALFAWAVLDDQVFFALVFVIPVLYGTGPLMAVSVLMAFAGMMLVFLSFFGPAARSDASAAPEGAKKEWGGVILIGPIPIVIGSAGMLRGRGAIILLAVLSVFVLALFLIAFLR